MAAYPRYKYEVQPDGQSYWIYLYTPNGGLANADEFRYSSNGDYPDYGKWWEAIGNWQLAILSRVVSLTWETVMEFAIVIEKAENNYAAYAPDLPGCIATGVTLEEAEQQIREAILFHLQGLREDGLPIPQPTSKVNYVVVAA